jgi:U3 small nucleolar RNA-associated protein MPP10
LRGCAFFFFCFPFFTRLVVENLEADQIWAELGYMNEPLGQFLQKTVKRAARSEVRFKEEEYGSELEESRSSEYGEPADSDMEEEEEEEEEDEGSLGPDQSGTPDFFDMDEMEKFVEAAEKMQMEDIQGDEEVMDLIEEAVGSDDEAGKVRYGDFFNDEEAGEDSGDEFDFVQPREQDPSLLSAVDVRAKKMKTQIEEIEDDLVADSHWALKGEVTKKDRPQSSLLESYLDFDQVTQGVPILTEEHTTRIEEVIKKRVLEGTFDEVLRKTENPVTHYKPKVQLEFSKNRKGLGEIFEEAYLKATSSHLDDDTPAEQKEAHRLFAELCRSLDSLTNGHYRPSAPKVKDVSVQSKNVAAITLEEVAPVGVSGSRVLAPEELGGRGKAVQLGEKEMGHEDRKRHRRLRKESSKKRKSEKEAQKRARAAADPVFAAKLQQAKELEAIGTVRGTHVSQDSGNGGTKAGKQYKSTAFFANLQEEMANVAAGGAVDPKKKRAKKSDKKAENYKL